MTAASSLKSTGVCKLLISLFWVRLGFAIVTTLFSVIEVALPSLYQIITVIDGLQAIGVLVINLSSAIVFIIWIHRIHADLKNLFTDYPITPGGALARFLIPFYNIWGIWNTLSTFAEWFNKEGGDLISLSNKLKSLIPFLYAFTFISRGLDRILFRQAFSEQGEIDPILLLISCVVDVGLAVALLLVSKTMGKILTQKVKREVT